MEPAFSSPISAFFKAFVMMLGEYQFEDYFTIEKADEDVENKSNINVNGTLQFIFFVYTLIVGIVLSYLIVALTVARMDEVYEKAEILQTVQKVMNIDEISLPFGFRKFIKFDWNSKPPLKFQLPFRGNNLTVK